MNTRLQYIINSYYSGKNTSFLSALKEVDITISQQLLSYAISGGAQKLSSRLMLGLTRLGFNIEWVETGFGKPLINSTNNSYNQKQGKPFDVTMMCANTKYLYNITEVLKMQNIAISNQQDVPAIEVPSKIIDSIKKPFFFYIPDQKTKQLGEDYLIIETDTSNRKYPVGSYIAFILDNELLFGYVNYLLSGTVVLLNTEKRIIHDAPTMDDIDVQGIVIKELKVFNHIT